MAHVLVVDDKRAVRVALDVNLTKAGHTVSLADTGERALDALRTSSVDAILTDLMMPGMGGMEFLAEVKRSWPLTQVIMMSGHGTVERAVEAMRLGAHDFVIKPIAEAELLAILDRALRERALHEQVEQLQAAASERFGFENIVGSSTAMASVFEQVSAVAPSDATVLVTGPTGTGKELIGKAIHFNSTRKRGPLVQVNCGALPSGLLESELFGHEKGAFTGAIRQHKGRFEQADGGTLMLDEVGEMPLETQVKLLRVLESGEFQRVGGTSTMSVDVRIVAATNRTLREEVQANRFREDLFYRLNVFEIALPPLSQRMEDIPNLVEHFVQKFAVQHRKSVNDVSRAAMDTLMGHAWPGNIRELEHTVERAIILADRDTITQFELPDPVHPTSMPEEHGTLNIAEILRTKERELVEAALRAEGGIQARAARRLGVSRANLNYRIQKLGISIADL